MNDLPPFPLLEPHWNPIGASGNVTTGYFMALGISCDFLLPLPAGGGELFPCVWRIFFVQSWTKMCSLWLLEDFFFVLPFLSACIVILCAFHKKKSFHKTQILFTQSHYLFSHSSACYKIIIGIIIIDHKSLIKATWHLL